MTWPADLLAAATIIVLVLAAWSDIAARIIPNGLVVALAAIGLLGRAAAGLPSLAISIALAAALFLLLVLAHARGVMGGGDVKLASAMALGLSPESVYRFVLITALAGGVLGCVHLVLRRVFRGASATPPRRDASLLRRVAVAERWRIARSGSLPYGMAIACGGIWTVLASPGG
ncbi:MAG: prepilin peptidase [Acetobacteraceae bacterium]